MSDKTIPDTPDSAGGAADPFAGDGLTARQRRFVEAILEQDVWNYTEAAIAAGYSEKSAKHIGSENMTKETILNAIAQRMAKRSDDTGIDAKWVLLELGKVHKDASADKTKDGRRDRMRALELIGKHVDVRAFRTQFGLSGPDGGPIEVKWNFAALTDEELETFERLLAKMAVVDGPPRGEGETGEATGAGEPRP